MAPRNRHGRVFAGCRHQREDRWGAKLGSARGWKLFSVRNLEPLQMCSSVPNGVYVFFLCLNNGREWLKGCEKPVYFKVRVETDIGTDVSYVRGSSLPAYSWRVLWTQKSLPENPDEEVKSLELAHRLRGLLALKRVRIAGIWENTAEEKVWSRMFSAMRNKTKVLDFRPL